jgi:hypothetical protein
VPRTNKAPVNHNAPAGEATVQPNAAASHAEPRAPDVFKAQKPGKAKVEEGSSTEGKDKPFCFRCYKPQAGMHNQTTVRHLW